MLNDREMSVLSSVNGRLKTSAYGAQVLEWVAGDDVPLLFLSPLSDPLSAAAVRGGVPVCFPWFGRADLSHADVVVPSAGERAAPSHGFARTSLWDVVEFSDSSVHYRLRHRGDAGGPAGSPERLFPHSFVADLHVNVSSDLIVTMSVLNTDDHSWAFEAALHSYFVVGDVKDVVIRGLEGCSFTDTIKFTAHVQHDSELSLVAPTDRIYRASGALTIEDPRGRRRISVDTDNTRSVIVWNPWAAGAAALPDLPDDSWVNFVCVEAGNVREDAVVLAPGEISTVSMRVSSSVL